MITQLPQIQQSKKLLVVSYQFEMMSEHVQVEPFVSKRYRLERLLFLL